MLFEIDRQKSGNPVPMLAKSTRLRRGAEKFIVNEGDSLYYGIWMNYNGERDSSDNSYLYFTKYKDGRTTQPTVFIQKCFRFFDREVNFYE